MGAYQVGIHIMPEKIAILDPGYESYQKEREILNDYQVEIYQGPHDDIREKIRFAGEAVGLLIRGTPVNDDFLQQLPALKAIVRYGVGFDNIDLTSCRRHGVKVSIVQNYGNHAVSDHALAMIYTLGRGIVQGVHSIYSNFAAPPLEEIFEFHDKTIGIIGLGRIGSTLALKTKSIFARTIASDPYLDPVKAEQLQVPLVSLPQLLAEAQVISIHCNLTEETRHLIEQKTFDQMKQKPILVNTARGPIVNEKDVLTALDAGQIHSYGVDVYEQEPPGPAQKDLIAHPRILATGHYAWYSEHSHVLLQIGAARNLKHLLAGQEVEDCLNC